MDYDELLKQYFGHEHLKPTQREIIEALLNFKVDVLAILATGFGKSICYQLPHLITGKSVLVISPLIALMQDQKISLEKKGIKVSVLNSTTMTSKYTKGNMIAEVFDGNGKIIFTTPEFVIKNLEFLQLLEANEMLCLICIDESHCISTYGHDFRESYTQLGVIRDNIKSIPILALTATATEKVRDDIVEILKMNEPHIIIGDFSRKNLYIEIKNKTSNIKNDLMTILQKYINQRVIIYCKTIKDTERVRNILDDMGIYCLIYHAGLKTNDRNDVQKQFTEGTCRCIIATIAFGMGIDIPDVRCVIHYGCPKNIEGYYQEIGRAGRDGKNSECIMLYDTKDFVMNRIFLKNMTNKEEMEYQNIQINKIEKYLKSTECRQKMILEHFGTKNVVNCNNCDNCKKTKGDHKKEINILLNDNELITLRCICDLKTSHRMRYGSTMLIKILKGSKSDKVAEWLKDFKYYGSTKSITIDKMKIILDNLKQNDMIMDICIPNSVMTVIEPTQKGIEYIKNLDNINKLKEQNHVVNIIEQNHVENTVEQKNEDKKVIKKIIVRKVIKKVKKNIEIDNK